MMNVADQRDVGHPEYDPEISSPLFVLATCPVENRPEGTPRLYGKLKIRVMPGTLSQRVYEQNDIEEPFSCNFELNPDYTEMLEKSGARISGFNENGIAGIVEFPDNTFYIATGFVPQQSSAKDNPHPLILAYLEAAKDYRLKADSGCLSEKQE